MVLIDDVKNAFRINDLPESIENNLKLSINAALLDLETGGVNCVKNINAESESKNALITTAVILYCRAYFSENQKSEKYAEAYEKLKNSLGASIKYGDADNV